jgi:hypothetical protein
MIRIIKSVATVRKIYGKNVENYSECCSDLSISFKRKVDEAKGR